MKILHLTLKKKWFDLIAMNQKKNEYRELKQYWMRRFRFPNGTCNYDEVHFKNGYSKDAPFMRVEYLSMGLIDGTKIKYLDNDKKYFDIRLGKVLEVRR